MNTRPNSSPPLPTSEGLTVSALVAESRRRLQSAGISVAGMEARVLVGHVLGLDPASLIARGDRRISHDEASRTRQAVALRVSGTPLAYITGRREFWSLPLHVDEHCLIPRSDTELLVACALARIPGDDPARRVIDLGTGSGAVILALKHERPAIIAFASDRSAEALTVAAGNARRLDLPVFWLRGHWFDAIAPRPEFDVIVSNPPYVAPGDPHLLEGDLRFEPAGALVSAEDGWADLKAIVSTATVRLRPDGWLLLEHGYGQGAGMRALLERHGFREVATYRDLGGRERVTEGRLP